MKLIHRLALQGFLRVLLWTVLGALVLFTLIDLFDHIENFTDNEATVGMMARFYLNKVPWTVDIVLPIAMLMATLFTVGSMARYNELTALFSSGRSLLYVTRPLLLAAALAGVFSLAWTEFVLPATNAEMERIWEVEVHGNQDRTRPTNDVALNGADGRLYYARTWVPTSSLIRTFRATEAEGSRLVRRWDAETAVWDGEQWLLEKGRLRVFDADGTVASVDTIVSLRSGLAGVTPDTFKDIKIKPEEMNIRRLSEYIRMIRLSGGDTTEYEVDLQFKLAFPLVHLIVVTLGIILASGPRKTTVASGFGWTILVSFGYYLAINYGRALGHSGVLPPIPAGWVGNMIFGAAAMVLLARIRR